MERPAPPVKSADDLKAILRTMTAKSGAEKEQKQSEHKESLKDALTVVLKNNQPPAAEKKPPEEKPAAAAPTRPEAGKRPRSDAGWPAATSRVPASCSPAVRRRTRRRG